MDSLEVARGGSLEEAKVAGCRWCLGGAGGDGSLEAACVDGLGFAAPWDGLGLVMSGSRGLCLAAPWQSLGLVISGSRVLGLALPWEGLGITVPWQGLGLVLSSSRGLGLAAAWRSLILSVFGWRRVDLVVSSLRGLVLMTPTRRGGLGLAGPCWRGLSLVEPS